MSVEENNSITTAETGTKVDLEVYYLKEERVPLDHNYAEVPTRHKGKLTGEKVLIDPKGAFIKTVGAGYTPLTHEMLEEKLREKFGSKYMHVNRVATKGISKHPRRSYHYIQFDPSVKIIVTNSTDASLATQIWTIVDNTMLVGKRFAKLYRMHTENFNVDEIVKAAETVLEYVARYRMIINDLSKLQIKDNLWILDQLAKEFEAEKLPKKYGEVWLTAARVGAGEIHNMADLYNRISQAVWSSEMEEKTKKHIYEILNDYMLVAWEVRPQEAVATA